MAIKDPNVGPTPAEDLDAATLAWCADVLSRAGTHFRDKATGDGVLGGGAVAAGASMALFDKADYFRRKAAEALAGGGD